MLIRKIFMFVSLCTAPCFALVFINDMTLEEKVGQLLMTHFNGEVVNEEAKTLIQTVNVGGIIYFNWANGLHSPKQIQSLSLGLQELSKRNRHQIPLFIAVDQEGGLVARLNQGFTIFPGNKALGMAGDPDLAEQSAYAIGQELRCVGVNINFSPVVDINSNPRNPIIGIRSFGDSPEIVVLFAKNALNGYRRAGVISTLKHYPGHGDLETDSHEDLPVVKKTKEDLEKNELLPFSTLANQADVIMTGHLMVPALDPKNCATLSKTILDYLRNKIGFNGVIISDSLMMEGLLKNYRSVDEVAIRALEAGCDILLLGGKQLNGLDIGFELTVQDIQRIHRSIVDAVKSGRVSEDRVNEAVLKILSLKKRLIVSENIPLNLNTFVNTNEHQALSKKIASLALKSIQQKPLPSKPYDQYRVAVFASEIVHESMNQTSLIQMGKNRKPIFFKGLNPTEEEMQFARDLANDADLLIFCSYNAWKNPSQAFLVQSLLETEKPLVLIALRDFLDAALFPKANLIISTYSPTATSIQAAYDLLNN